jgi:hypothetical protein
MPTSFRRFRPEVVVDMIPFTEEDARSLANTLTGDQQGVHGNPASRLKGESQRVRVIAKMFCQELAKGS